MLKFSFPLGCTFCILCIAGFLSCSRKQSDFSATDSTVARAVTSSDTISIPATRMYIEPFVDYNTGISYSPYDSSINSHIYNWSNNSNILNWFIDMTPGEFRFTFQGKLQAGQTNNFKAYILNINTNQSDSATIAITGTGASAIYTLFNSKTISNSGFYKISLKAISKSGAYYSNIERIKLIRLNGTSGTGNTNRNMSAPAGHANFSAGDGVNRYYDWLYHEIVVPPGYDPSGTYWATIGYYRGYYGIQTNSLSERRFIHSAWDANYDNRPPTEPLSQYLVKTLDKGANVYANSFTGEGTGGHSHLKYFWQTGTKVRFLMNMRKIGDNDAVVTAWWSDVSNTTWQYLTSFYLPKATEYFTEFYSFIENFSPFSGQYVRKGYFQTQWGHQVGGDWVTLNKTSLHSSDGAVDGRYDCSTGLNPSNDAQVVLQAGGYIPPSQVSNVFANTAASTKPVIDFTSLSARVDQALQFANPVVSGMVYELKPACATTRNLDAYGWGTTNGSDVGIWSDHSGANQRWLVKYVGGGYYKLTPKYVAGKCLDVNTGSAADNTKVQLWDDNSGNAQKWKIEPDGSGNYYTLTPACAPNSRLTVANGTDANNNVVIYTANSSNAQKWKLEIILNP